MEGVSDSVARHDASRPDSRRRALTRITHSTLLAFPDLRPQARFVSFDAFIFGFPGTAHYSATSGGERTLSRWGAPRRAQGSSRTLRRP